MLLPDTDPLGAALARLAGLLPQSPSPERLAELRAAAAAAVAALKAAHHTHGYPEAALEAAAALWNHSLTLGDAPDEDNATLKQAALDLQWAALEPSSLPSTHQIRMAEQALRTAELWGELGHWEAADAALSHASALSSALSSATGALQDRAAVALFGSLLLRLRVCLRLGQELPAGAALLKLKEVAGASALAPRHRTVFTLDLLAALVFEGEALLEGNKPSLAVQMLQAAHEAHGALAAAASELAAAGVAADAEAVGARALVLLAWAHLEAGGDRAGEKALGCVQALQRLGGRAAAAVAVPLLAHRALLHAGRAADAHTELLKLVTHEDAAPETCAAAIKAALASPGGADAARTALAAAQEIASSEDYSLVLYLTEAVLGDPNNINTKTSIKNSSTNISAPPMPSDDALEVVLEVLEDDALTEALEERTETHAAAKARLRALCWNAACAAMESGGSDGGGGAVRAARLFLASTRFLAEGDTEGALEVNMALALCDGEQGNAAAALKHLAIADAIAPGHPAVALLRLRACLAAGDETSAADAVKEMATGSNSGADALRVACCEAMDAGAPAAARAALEGLLAKMQAPGGVNADESLPEGYEAVVFQNLIQLELAAATEHVGRGRVAREALARLFGALVERLKHVGLDKFYCGEEGGRWSGLQWSQLQAWNAGVAAAGAGALKPAAALMGRCGDLCALHPVPDAAIIRRGHLAYVMAAAAAMDGPDPSTTALALAAQHLAAANAAAAAAPEGALDPKALVYAHILGFHAAVHRGDAPAAAAAVAAAAATPAASAEHFSKMAHLAERCPEARRAALEAALTSITSLSDVNYAAAAAACRGLLDAAAEDGARLAALKEAAALAAAAPPGAFPAIEARYMATFAWNRGAMHAKLGRPGAAAPLMAAALRLARGAPGEGGQPVLGAEDVEKMKDELERVKAAAEAEGSGAAAAAAGGIDSDWMVTE